MILRKFKKSYLEVSRYSTLPGKSVVWNIVKEIDIYINTSVAGWKVSNPVKENLVLPTNIAYVLSLWCSNPTSGNIFYTWIYIYMKWHTCKIIYGRLLRRTKSCHPGTWQWRARWIYLCVTLLCLEEWGRSLSSDVGKFPGCIRKLKNIRSHQQFHYTV